MRIGYSFWGFLGDFKIDDAGNELSTPDGNATYSWSIIWEAQQRGHAVHCMQENRDNNAWNKFGSINFSSFSEDKRTSAYCNLIHTSGKTYPELDVLLLEWRWPIPGRNCEVDNSDGMIRDVFVEGKHSPDWIRQWDLINHYKSKNTKIILWDLDHKITHEDEMIVKPDAIFETSVSPLELTMKRTRVEPPFVISDLLQHPTVPVDSKRKMVYIGSRYERDDVINEWIKPVSDKFPGSVEFHGNWLNTEDECKKLWPDISFHKRCTTKDFYSIYSTAATCPLLAKKSYLSSGFVTPRVWETLLFGAIPIGLGSAKGISQYVEFVAKDDFELGEIAYTIAVNGNHFSMKDKIRKSNVERLEFMDAKYFVDKIEKAV